MYQNLTYCMYLTASNSYNLNRFDFVPKPTASSGFLLISRGEKRVASCRQLRRRLWARSRVAAACFSLFQEQESGAMAGGAGKRSKHPRARTGTDTLQAHTRPDETLEAADEGAEAVGRSIELVFGDGKEGEGGSGSGTRGGRGVHGAARFRIWPSQQMMRELPEGGVGGKRTRSGRRREEGETLAFITSSGSQATWINGARLEKDKRTALHCGDEVVLAGGNDAVDTTGATQGKRQALKGRKSGSVQVGGGDEGRVAEQLRCGICLCTLHKPVTLVPCLHSFCAGCYSDWMRQQETCPDCRAPCGQVGRSHTLHNVVAAFVEAHPEFSREQEEIERLDGKDRLSEAVGRLGTHAPEGAGVVNHGALGGGGQKRSGVRRKRRGNMTFQRRWEGCEQMRVDLLCLT